MPENNSSSPSHSPEAAEGFGTVPKDAESFGSIPHDSESFRTVPKGAERKESHTLTVREAARLFESAGVARTERSVTNWCQPNKSGIARLDAYFDPNERKYFITAQSVEMAIQEEKAKTIKNAPSVEASGDVPNPSEAAPKREQAESGPDIDRVKNLEQEVMDLKITNRAKDYFIEELRKERENFAIERNGYVEQLISSNRKVAELETKFLQLDGPRQGESN